jgi:gentisate 1,2-dioxygenase
MKKVSIRNELQDWKAFRFKKGYAKEGFCFKNLKEFPLENRKARGTVGVHFNLSGNKIITAHVSEIAPGGSNKRHRHTAEAIIYVLSGRGYTIIQEEGKAEKKIDWEEGDLFSPPLFAWHQHFNADVDRPARYLAVSTSVFMHHLGVLIKERWEE